MRRSLAPVVVGGALLAGTAAPHANARPAADRPVRASAKPCVPARGLVVPMTIRRNLNNGSEVTEPLTGDGYRITRCDSEGQLTISMTVLPIRDSDGKIVLLPAVTVRRTSIISPTYGDPVRDTRYRAVFRRGLSTLLASVLAPTPGTPRRDPNFGKPSSATAAAQSACNDKTHTASPGKWPDNHYGWRWNAKSFGENSTTLSAFKKAHEQWDLTVNDCSMKDLTNFTTSYDGTTTRHAGVKDGVSTIDKADLSKSSCGSSAIACTWVWWVSDTYTETDTRFATRVKWSNSSKGKAGTYDYQGIGAHEFGHSLGLSDLDDSSKLTMHFQGTLGYTGQRTLGRGDVLGARALYGG